MRVVEVEAVEEVEEEREFDGGVTGTHSDRQLSVKKVASKSCGRLSSKLSAVYAAIDRRELSHLESVSFLWGRDLVDLLIRQLDQGSQHLLPQDVITILDRIDENSISINSERIFDVYSISSRPISDQHRKLVEGAN